MKVNWCESLAHSKAKVNISNGRGGGVVREKNSTQCHRLSM